ncbi:Glycosyl transferase family 2 [Azoarcus sp. Aa7]|nr:Glycosyl transferase family 2 [Azoarcus sp. Aa7]
MKAIYILLPHNTRTGGPEALLQLSDALAERMPDVPSHVVCYNAAEIADLRAQGDRKLDAGSELVFGEREIGIPEYAGYRSTLAHRVPRTPESVVVLPEVLADLVPLFRRNTVLLWWLSVDNAFPALGRINMNHLRRPGVFHASQSTYAERFLSACGLPSLGLLSDYTPDSFGLTTAATARERLIVLNASAKVVSDLDAVERFIHEQAPDAEVRRLAGLSRKEVAHLLGRASVYVDLASFPGKDRLPREAAQLGCAVLVAAAGAGIGGGDFPVPQNAIVSPWNAEEVARQAVRLLDPTEADANRATMRQVIANERAQFFTEVSSVFSALADSAETAPQEAPVAHTEVHLGKDVRNNRYQLWRSRRTPQEIDGQIHAERMLNTWRFRPRFTFGMNLESPEAFALLADTVDALARQWYPEWQLVVFAANQAEPPEVADIPHIVWISDPAIVPSYRNALAAADGDFVSQLPAGTTLDDHALQLISDHVNRASGWLAFYLDHDEQDAAGNVLPRFKPDFNADLLYAQNYIGPVAFICREAIQAFADANEAGAPEPYGLLVRLFEQASAATIGHIADPLIHLPSRPTANLAYEQTVLEQHFARTKRSANIESGWFEGTRRIRFAKADGCLLSVIVMTHCLPGYLRCSLESLRKHGGHESLEVIVVAHRVSDPDLQHLLASYAAGGLGIPVSIRHEDGEFAPAAFRNRAAATARGDYLLFLDDDAEFFQPDSLAHLLSYVSATGLAAAAPRLVSADEGNPRIVGSAAILGFQSLAGSIAPADASLLDASRELRLQLDQEASSLPSNCLLVDKRWFTRLGGFDEQAAPMLLHDLDFCIKARKAGARLAWLPSIDVIHHGGLTLREIANDPLERARWSGIQEREHESMLDRHLRTIAEDPAYNRNLSFREPFLPDVQAVPDWDTAFRDRPRLLGVPLTTGAGQYRLVAPFKALARAALAQCTVVHPIRDNLLRALTPTEVARLAPDTLVYQNCIEEAMIQRLAESRRWNPDVFHICTIDDRLGDLPRDNPLYAFHARQGRTQLRKTLSHCDRLIVSTEPLREYCADLIEDIRVVPNRLERDVWTGLKVAINEGKRPRVGWVGAMQHGGDLRLLEPVVRDLAAGVDWVFMGMCPDFLKPYVCETHDFVSIRDYPAKMASLALDLALAPLEIHPFNECKSNLRLLEYGALGWPVICTDIDPYRTGSPPVTRLPNTSASWIDAIRERLADRAALRAEGARLRQWAYAGYMLEDGLEAWLDAFLRNPAKRP